MTDLEDTFGSEFVKKHQQERARRRAERESVEDEELAKICALAINENKMEPENPMFTYTSETGVVHDVLLVTVPDPDNKSYWSFKKEGTETSVMLPLDYLGQWISAWFNDRDLAKELEPGERFFVVGRLDTFERDDGSEGESFSPVRGLAHISQAKEWADMALEADGFEVPEQPEDEDPAVLEDTDDTTEEDSEESDEEEENITKEEALGGTTEQTEDTSESGQASSELDSSESQSESDDSDDDNEAGQFSNLLQEKQKEKEEEKSQEDEKEELVEYEAVRDQVQNLGENEPRVWEVTEGDTNLLNKLSNMVGNRLDLQMNAEGAIADSNVAEEVREHCIRAIAEHNENNNEDEEEEDNLFS